MPLSILVHEDAKFSHDRLMTSKSLAQASLPAVHPTTPLFSSGHAQNWTYIRRRLSEDIDKVMHLGVNRRPQGARNHGSMVLSLRRNGL